MKNNLFKLDDEFAADLCEINSGALTVKFLQMHQMKVKYIEDLIGKLPKENEISFLWTINSFNAFSFIPLVIINSGIITELTVATYSIGKRTIDDLMYLMDEGKILKAHILVSDSIKTRLTSVNDHLLALIASKRQLTVKYAWNHSKIALMRSGDNHFILEGSGNWNDNAQHEHYDFLNSKEVYEFRRNEILTVGINA
jgi:hypothetical protein